MWGWIKHLDRLLRGEATGLDSLQSGQLDIPIFGLSFVIVILGMVGVALYVERDCGLTGGLLGIAVALASAFYFWPNQQRM